MGSDSASWRGILSHWIFPITQCISNEQASNLSLMKTLWQIFLRMHIPTVVGHPFRFISDSHSNSKRTPIPIDIGQSFRFDIGHFFGESERCPISSEGCPTCLGTVSDMVGTH